MNNSKNIKPSFDEFIGMINESRKKIEDKTMRKIQEIMKDFDPIQSFAVFCGLATIGELQSNHIRIANLLHASLKFGKGKKQIEEKDVRHLFKLFGDTSAGVHEDPAEDVFLAIASSQRSSYRIFEGNWEGSAFYLERFLHIVDGMPDYDLYASTKRSVYALLHLSNFVASKSGEKVNTVTGAFPLSEIPEDFSILPAKLQKKIKFTQDDVNAYGFNTDDLSPFIFDMELAKGIPIPSHYSLTELDRHPIIDAGNGEYFLFPQGVSPAIRTYIISTFNTQRDQEILTSNLIDSYRMMIQDYQLLRKIPSPPPMCFCPVQCDEIFVQEFSVDVTEGRPLHLLFLFEGFQGQNLFNNWIESPTLIKDTNFDLAERIERVKRSVSERYSLKHGITLLVSAGWGKSFGVALSVKDTEDWSVRHISVHDLCHISDHPEMKPLHLWRIIEAEKKFLSLNGTILNMNGILNLFGWLLENDWHIVPHDRLPQEDFSTGLSINIPTNHIAEVRETARKTLDRKIILDIEEKPRKIIKYAEQPYFQEDKDNPLYGCFEIVKEGKLSAVYLGKTTSWWCKVNKPNRNGPDFRIWDSAISWLRRIDREITEAQIEVPVIIEWELSIEDHNDEIPIDDQITSNFRDQSRILTVIKMCPGSIFNRADNSGEFAMVQSFIATLLTDENTKHLDGLMKNIFPNQDAKYFHFFFTRTFNDHFTNLPNPILIEGLDDANLRLGLGWVDEPKGSFVRIEGARECVGRLNKVVDKIWENLYRRLKKYGKTSLCHRLLLNIEAIEKEKKQWERTVRACLALHDDKDNVIKVITNRTAKLNAANLAGRLLIEMAICTCSNQIDTCPDELDISELLAYASLLFHLGSWSDAIKAELFSPEIYISSFGEIMLDTAFDITVMNPLHSILGKKQRESEAQTYEQLYENIVDTRQANDAFPEDFLQSWEKESHVSVDIMRLIMDVFEDIGIKTNNAILTMKRSELVKKITKSVESIDQQKANLFLSKISLPSRSRWDQQKELLPNEMEPQDWYPWNFRRKLSFISRPIVELESNEDPLLLLSPGFFRESICYLLRNSLNATFDERHFHSDEMKKWIGNRRNKLGKKFNAQVAEKLIGMGWQAQSDVLVTEILNAKTDKDFGDVDVFAWSKKHGLVVAIECKNLHFAKTYKEIGNQINEFRGLKNKGKKRDRLLRHFDRLQVLTKNLSSVSRYTGISSLSLSQVCGALVFSHINVAEYAPQIPRERILVTSIEALYDSDQFAKLLIPWE